MQLIDAIELVIELARQNMTSEEDNLEERERQLEAINMVEDFALNNLGDD